MNKIILIGRLTNDPTLTFIPNSGTAVARFSVAVNREFKKEGQPDADFFNVVVWGKTAENCANYLKKGRLVGIEGQLRNNNFEDKNGVKHYSLEINANRVEFLEWGDKQDNQSNNQPKQQSNQQNTDYDSFQAMEDSDEIPFF